MLFQDGFDRLAEIVEQRRQDEEACSSRDQRQQDEESKIIAEEPADDRHELERNRRESLHQNECRAPFLVELPDGVDLLRITVERNQPVPDRIEQKRADRVAESAA